MKFFIFSSRKSFFKKHNFQNFRKISIFSRKKKCRTKNENVLSEKKSHRKKSVFFWKYFSRWQNTIFHPDFFFTTWYGSTLCSEAPASARGCCLRIRSARCTCLTHRGTAGTRHNSLWAPKSLHFMMESTPNPPQIYNGNPYVNQFWADFEKNPKPKNAFFRKWSKKSKKRPERFL